LPRQGVSLIHTMNAKRILSGISIRETQVRRWLKSQNFKGEYLLVSTKPESVYFKKLHELSPETKLMVDLYTPILLEKELTLSKWKLQDWLTRIKNKEMVRKFLRRGNHFLVANRRQREYWLKISKELGANLTEGDVSVLPTGAGRATSNKQQATTFGERKVVLWFGGIYPWMDPLPLVEAFGDIAKKFPDWKLRFLGGFHPDTGYKNLYQKVESAAKLKITNSQLEFIPWQPEKDLVKYFKDVAFAVHLAKSTLEDYYAHRVRLLTLLDAGIPVITGGRDMVSDLIDEIKAGIKVNGSVGDLTSKLEMVMSDSKILTAWRLQTSMIWKLLRKRYIYIPAKWRKMPDDRIKDRRI